MPSVTKGGLHQVCVYLTPAEMGRLKTSAQANGRSIAAETRMRLVPGLGRGQGSGKSR